MPFGGSGRGNTELAVTAALGLREAMPYSALALPSSEAAGLRADCSRSHRASCCRSQRLGRRMAKAKARGCDVRGVMAATRSPSPLERAAAGAVCGNQVIIKQVCQE